MAILIPRKQEFWQRQPGAIREIDYSRELARGLTTLITGVGDGRLYDIAHGSDFASNTATVRNGTDGIGAEYASQYTKFQNHDDYSITGAMSIAAIIDIDTLTNYSGIAACQTTTQIGGFELRAGNGQTDSKVMIHRANAGGFRQHRPTTNALIAGDKNAYIGISAADGLLETVPAMYVKGVKQTLSVGGNGTGQATLATGELNVGQRYDGVTRLDGAVYYLAFWDVELSEEEHAELRQNPYQLLKKRQKYWVLPTAGATAVLDNDLISAMHFQRHYEPIAMGE